jgi:hypothetical protein
MQGKGDKRFRLVQTVFVPAPRPKDCAASLTLRVKRLIDPRLEAKDWSNITTRNFGVAEGIFKNSPESCN